jgi:hypothetical protein
LSPALPFGADHRAGLCRRVLHAVDVDGLEHLDLAAELAQTIGDQRSDLGEPFDVAAADSIDTRSRSVSSSGCCSWRASVLHRGDGRGLDRSTRKKALQACRRGRTGRARARCICSYG